MSPLSPRALIRGSAPGPPTLQPTSCAHCAPMADRPRVAVLGSSSAAVQGVLKETCGAFGVEHQAGPVVELSISTKYYTAEVTLADHDALSAENVPGSEPGQAAFGVILVFDAREAGSLERLLEAYTRHNLQASGDELCLLVAFAPGEGAPTAVSSSRPAALEWALANGFELVELAEQGPVSESDERNKVGAARVREALESTMWPNMEMRSPQDAGGADGVGQDEEPAASPARAPSVRDMMEASGYTPEDGEDGEQGAEARAWEGGETGAAGGEAEDEPAGPAPLHEQSAATSAIEAAMASLAGGGGGGGLGRDEDDVDAVMESIREARSFALGGEVTDEDRRERATAAAMRLMALMGLSEDGDSGEEGKEYGDGPAL